MHNHSLERHCIGPFQGHPRRQQDIRRSLHKLNFDPGQIALLLHLFHLDFSLDVKLVVELGRQFMIGPSVKVLEVQNKGLARSA
jgi:hypothetical protein